jgi:hypothetical protein
LGIWFSCPASQKIQTPAIHGLAGVVIGWPIYRLVCKDYWGRRP